MTLSRLGGLAALLLATACSHAPASPARLTELSGHGPWVLACGTPSGQETCGAMLNHEGEPVLIVALVNSNGQTLGPVVRAGWLNACQGVAVVEAGDQMTTLSLQDDASRNDTSRERWLLDRMQQVKQVTIQAPYGAACARRTVTVAIPDFDVVYQRVFALYANRQRRT